nr:DNA polymerase III subunit beta [Dehalococcoidales bacterium]
GRGNVTLPVLAYAQLSVNHGEAKLTTTDLEKAVEVSLNTNGQDDFTVLLPRKRTQVFLTGKNGKTSIDLDDKGLVTLERSDMGSLQFKPYSVKDFPPIPAPTDNMTWATIDAKWFCQMLDILIPACAQELSRPVLTGVVFSDGTMVSADGFRMVGVEHEKANFGLGDKQVIIPFQTLILIKRLFGKEDTISFGFHHPDMVYFKSDKILLTSQIIQGNFPNWKQLIPDKYTCRVSFSSPLMMQRLGMVDAAALTAGIIRLQFQRTEPNNEPECLLTGGTKDEDFTEYYSMRLPVKIETREEAKIAFNYKYLCDALKPFSVCNLDLTSPSSPGKFTGDIEGLTIVVMPMFVQW